MIQMGPIFGIGIDDFPPERYFEQTVDGAVPKRPEVRDVIDVDDDDDDVHLAPAANAPKEMPKPMVNPDPILTKITKPSLNFKESKGKKAKKMKGKLKEWKEVLPDLNDPISPNNNNNSIRGGGKKLMSPRDGKKSHGLDHGKMVLSALEALNEDGGSTRDSIAKCLVKKYDLKSGISDVKRCMRQKLRLFVKSGKIRVTSDNSNPRFELKPATCRV